MAAKSNASPREGLTFDDVLIKPGLSEVLPGDVDIRSHITNTIPINIPIIASAMDTVTEVQMAIAMAQAGGMGVIHRNLEPEAQAAQVRQVKKFESGMVVNPLTIEPTATLQQALDLMKDNHISGVPVVEGGGNGKAGKLVGILTNRDVRFATNPQQRVAELMTKDKLVTVREGVSQDEAKRLLHQHRIEKLLVVDDDYRCTGLITVKDIQKRLKYPNAAKDDKGRLRVGAAIGATGDFLERAAEMVKAKTDVLAIDSAHGHTTRVIDAIKLVKARFPEVDLIAGNVGTFDGACELARAGADAIKVGIGPGSICTTRIVTGAGVPQITAIAESARALRDAQVPIIADGGIKYSGDITKAIAAGASCVMIGSLLAGTEESPGETILYQGRSFKAYRGMGSLAAMAEGSSDRYFQTTDSDSSVQVLSSDDGSEGNRLAKLVPEGIEGRVPYRGTVGMIVYQLVGGVKSGMGYAGCGTISELQQDARFVRISGAGLRESHVHDVMITREAPNYRVE